jgi:NAD(P)H dehydrogenase (quinone)
MSKTKQILVIIGHSSTKSLSHKLAIRYAEAARAAGKEVEVIDIYRMQPEMPIQRYEDYSEWDRDKEIRQHYQKKIADADKIAIFHPIWWGGMPPLLKNFIDQTLTPGFAFRYRRRSWLPQALNIKPDGYLKSKKAHVFLTYDGYTLGFAGIAFPFITVWVVSIFVWCGITNMRFTLHQRTRWAGEDKRSKWLDRAERLGKKA